MSTPFQKAFPDADENTVFEVVENYSGYSVGDQARLAIDDGTTFPVFAIEGRDFKYAIHLLHIRIKEPQLNKGDWCLVSRDNHFWDEREFLANVNELWGLNDKEPFFVKDGDSFSSFPYAKPLPLPQTQTVTLQDGTELTIPNDAVDKLREEYA